MVRKQCPVLELANQMPVRNMDLARAPRRTARKKGSGYENGFEYETGVQNVELLSPFSRNKRNSSRTSIFRLLRI